MISVEWYRHGYRYIKVEIELEGCLVKKIVVSGDFFANPENIIDVLEYESAGKSIGEVIRMLDEVLKNNVIGVDSGELVCRLRKIIGEKTGCII